MRFYSFLILLALLLTVQSQTQEDDDKGTILKVSVKMFKDNKPAAYARVHVRKVIDVGRGEKPFKLVHITNDEGVIHFKSLAPGEYYLSVDGFWPEGGSFIPISADIYAIDADAFIDFGTKNGVADGGKVIVKGDEKVIHHTITLYSSAKLKVIVTYDDGTPIKGAKITPTGIKYGLKSFTIVEADPKKPHKLGNITDENGEYTIVGFNAELEPEISIEAGFGEELLPGFQEDNFWAYQVLRYKTISNIKISSKQENSILIRFRRLDRAKVVARGKLKLTVPITAQWVLASALIYIQDSEVIKVYAGKINVQDREIICSPDDEDGFTYTFFDINPSKYQIRVGIRLVSTDEDRFPIWEALYNKTTEIQIEKDKVTTLDITLTEDDKTTEHHFGH